MELGEIIAVAVPVIGGIIWLIRLEGRLNTHERSCEERQKRLDERHADIGKKLDYMVTQIDRLLESRP